MTPPPRRERPEWPARVLGMVLSGAVGLLVIGHFCTPYLPSAVVSRIHLNTEASLPAWLSASMLLAVAWCSAWLWWVAPPGQRLHWAWLAVGYLYLSADEAARLHELVDKLTPIKWVFLYAPVALIVFIQVCRGVAADRDGQGRWIVGGMVVFGIGGLGFEALSSLLHPLSDFWQEIEYAGEEGLEMLGTIGVLVGCASKCLVRRAATVASSGRS